MAGQGNTYCVGLLMGALLLGPVGVRGAPPTTNVSSSSESAQAKGGRSILSVKVKSFAVKDADMEQALRALRVQDVSRILIGFERIPHREGEEDRRISLALSDAGVVEIVHRLCEADPRYDYDLVKDLLIEVWPKGAKGDPRDLLNTKIREYSIDRTELPQGAVEEISQDAPELREFLKRKNEEWAKRTGRPTGVAGSIFSGNMSPPNFTLHVENASVREILNAIALRSVEMFHEGKAFGPTSWEYDFIMKPDSPTGLDGFPKWMAF